MRYFSVFASLVAYCAIICILSLLQLKKAQDYLETMQTIDLHHLQCQTEGLFGSFCDENRLRGENFSFAKYRNRVILVKVSQLQMAITFFALDRLSQLAAQKKGICQPNPTLYQS